MARSRVGQMALVSALGLALAGCAEGTGPFAGKSSGDDAASTDSVPQATSVKLVDRDGKVHIRRLPASNKKARAVSYEF